MHFLVGDCGYDMKFRCQGRVDTLEEITCGSELLSTPMLFLDLGTRFQTS